MICNSEGKELKNENNEIKNGKQTTEMRGPLKMWDNSLLTNNRNIDQRFHKGEERGES